MATGGGRPAGLDKGWYVEPTVFADVDNKMRIAQEEIFGPVLAVIPYDGEDDAVAIANDSNYGLCGSVWTADNDRGLDVARQVRTGTYMLNTGVPIDFATPVRRLQGVRHRPGVRARGPRHLPREEVDRPARPGSPRPSDRRRPGLSDVPPAARGGGDVARERPPPPWVSAWYWSVPVSTTLKPVRSPSPLTTSGPRCRACSPVTTATWAADHGGECPGRTRPRPPAAACSRCRPGARCRGRRPSRRSWPTAEFRSPVAKR